MNLRTLSMLPDDIGPLGPPIRREQTKPAPAPTVQQRPDGVLTTIPIIESSDFAELQNEANAHKARDVEVAAWCFAVPILALIACGAWHLVSWLWGML